MNEYAKYIPVKSAIEDLFGKEAWYALKESGSVSVWRKYTEKTLKALELSIHESVKHCDTQWLYEVNREIARGLESIKRSKTIDEVIAALAGALVNVAFLQVGFMPQRKGVSGKVTLKRENWDLSQYRSVIYLQSRDQKERAFWSSQQRRIGFQKQMDLRDEYRRSQCKLPYSEWCEKMEKPNE